jgi:hypothetical protein
MRDLLQNPTVIGAGVTAGLWLLAWVIPNEKLKTIGRGIGLAATKTGCGKLGRKAWEKTESFFQNSSGAFLAGIKEGLDSDDEPEEKPKA